MNKAGIVADEVNKAAGREIISPMQLQDHRTIPDGKYLAIQGTSVGLSPHDDEVVIEDPEFYQKVHTGFDLIYSPWETKFMRLVRETGEQAYNGLKMLLYQGVIAYELWNQIEVPEKEASEVYDRLKKHFVQD